MSGRSGSSPSWSSSCSARWPAPTSTSRKAKPSRVNAEGVKKRDLEAIVTASGTIQAKRFVNISAVQMGRVTRLAVEEGDRVKAGQFLLEIDPNALRGTVERGEAAVAARAGRPRAGPASTSRRREANLQLARDQVKRQRDLWAQQLTTKENLDRAESRPEGPRDGAAGAPDRRELARADDQAGGRLARHQPVQPAAGDADRALRWHRHPPQHRGGRKRRRRHDEQRRHAAAHRGRHVDHRGRGRGGRDRHSVGAASDRRPRSRSTRCRTSTFTGKVTEIGNSPIQQTHGHVGRASRRRTSR